MLKSSFFIAVAMTLCVSALAAEQKKITVADEGGPITYIIPADGPTGHWKAAKYGSLEYAGRIMVSGKYEYGWATFDPKDEDNYGQKFLSFILDKPSITKLPYWSRDGQVADELLINNPDEFAKAVIPKDQLTRLEARKIKTIHGTVTIWVEKFQTTVECDHQHHYADFSSVVNQTYLASQQFSDGNGC